MKALYSQLNSLVPHQSTKVYIYLFIHVYMHSLKYLTNYFFNFLYILTINQEVISLPDQLDEAATYIKKLQVSLERMKEKKNSLMGFENSANHSGSGGVRATGSSSSTAAAARSGFITDTAKTSPRVEIHGMGSALEVVLTTGPDCQFMFNETIRILYEEGADVVNASFSLVNEDTVFHTIHCKVLINCLYFTTYKKTLLKYIVEFYTHTHIYVYIQSELSYCANLCCRLENSLRVLELQGCLRD